MTDHSNSTAEAMPARVPNPFAAGQAVAPASQGASAAALAQREVADAQATRLVARQYPRDPVKAMDRIINSFSRPSLAEEAEYQYARGGQDITGPSIRAAEEFARQWGNISAGVAELARYAGMSECLAWAEDLETGYREEKRFFVRHWRDTKAGGYRVTDERDIYELIANHGARRKRACILAIIPIDVQETAMQQARLTLQQKAEITPENIKTMIEAFAQFGVTKEHIEKRLQRRIESMTPAQLLNMRRIYNSLRDGMSTPADWFEMEQPAQQAPASASASARAKEILRGGASTAKVSDKPSESTQKPQKPQEAADQPVPAQQTGGNGRAPDVNAALSRIAAANTSRELNKAWKEICAEYSAANLPVPIEIEAARNDRRAALEQHELDL